MTQGYQCESWPAIGEILTHAWIDGPEPQLRYLRQAQFIALETYWYLRLVLDTPSVPSLYEHLYEKLVGSLVGNGYLAGGV